MRTFPEIPNTELFLVGGSVMDTLLGVPMKDRDFVVLTEMTFPEFIFTLRSMPGVNVFQERPEFLTVRCLIDREPIDIAFPRAEGGYIDLRHPSKVERVSTLREDAARRDFTMNALFMNSKGEILDFFGGQNDIQRRKITAVGDPTERFTEDALRILRAVRFECKLGFHLEFNTHVAMERMAPNLSSVKSERIMEELNQAFKFDPQRAFNWVRLLNLWKVLKEGGLNFQLTAARLK